MNQTNNTTASIDLAQLDKLLSEYWDIAYSEGQSGKSRCTEAQLLLSSIRSLARRSLTSGAPAALPYGYMVTAPGVDHQKFVYRQVVDSLSSADRDGIVIKETLYAAPVHDAAASSAALADKEARQKVAEALGLGRDHRCSFTWAYLLGAIRECVIATEEGNSSAGAAAKTEQALLTEILSLAEQGMCHGLLADDYCSQIVDKIKGAAGATASEEDCARCGGSQSVSDPRSWQLERVPCPECSATAAGAGSAQPDAYTYEQAQQHAAEAVAADRKRRAEGGERTDFEPFTLAELDEMETVARAAPATWYGTYQIIDGISDEKAVELIEACSPDSIITLVRQARAALARAPLPAQDGAPSLRDVEELFGEYWDIAYREGQNGSGESENANAVLEKLRRLFAAMRANDGAAEGGAK